MIVHIDPRKNWQNKFKMGVAPRGVALMSIYENGHNSVIFQAITSKFCMVVYIDPLQKLAMTIRCCFSKSPGGVSKSTDFCDSGGKVL